MKTHWTISALASGCLLISCEKKDSASTESSSDASDKSSPSLAANKHASPAAEDPSSSVANEEITEVFLEAHKDWPSQSSSATVLEEIEVMKGAVMASVGQPDKVVDFLTSAPNSPRRLSTLRTVFAQWVKSDPAAAKEKADLLTDSKVRSVARMAVVSNTPATSDSELTAWIHSWPEDAPEQKMALDILERRANPNAPHVCGPECDQHAAAGK
ncbi:hypothetical protein NT6N_13160 [Oceaniferula spumae]|uniref:HEAT repeat domain-containing protein n=1 Tax=Oceaniferula spumae TaxID=2979115 RepID=A0AAT9FJL7_9BACT